MSSLSKSLPSRISRHPCKVAVFLCHVLELSEGQYFPIKILDIKSSGLLSILLLNFPRKTSLKAWKSLNPKPPMSFGCIIFSHKTHAIFFCPSWSSYQNIVTADWIRLQKETGNLKQLIACDGMGESILLIIVIFPSFDKNLFNQLLPFFLILPPMEVKRSLFLLPNCSGKPRSV